MNKNKLPGTLPVFPLSNFIIFPKTSVPLNIFEPRYLEMVNDCLKKDRIIGMIQPKFDNKKNNKPDLYSIGCAGKITSFDETDDNRIMLVLSGVSRFKVLKEVNTEKSYRECEVNFKEFEADRVTTNNKLVFNDLKLTFNNLKSFFKKKGLVLNWEELKKQNIDQALNTLCMIAPFTMEEKQVLLESKSLVDRKDRLQEIIYTYVSTYDFNDIESRTIQ